MIARIPRQHGRGSFVVRGVVESVSPATRTWWGLFKTYPTVGVRIDDVPYQKIQILLGDRPTPTQVFRIGWNVSVPLPSEKTRVWVTFAYAHEQEVFFEGSPRLSFRSIVPIENEMDTQEHELLDLEPALPLQF